MLNKKILLLIPLLSLQVSTASAANSCQSSIDRAQKKVDQYVIKCETFTRRADGMVAQLAEASAALAAATNPRDLNPKPVGAAYRAALKEYNLIKQRARNSSRYSKLYTNNKTKYCAQAEKFKVALSTISGSCGQQPTSNGNPPPSVGNPPPAPSENPPPAPSENPPPAPSEPPASEPSSPSEGE